MPRAKADPKPIARLVWVLGDVVTIDAPGPNSAAAQQLISALEERRALNELDVAGISTLISLAMAVDSMPGDARLWAQYRQAIDSLRALDRTSEDDDDWTTRMGAPEVRDPPKPRPAKPRAPGRGGKSPARKATDAVPAARVGRRPRDKS